MELRNDAGDPVDPVPFLVAASLAFLVVFSAGPIYFRALFGVDLGTALGASAVVFLAATAAAYRRLVVRARPELRGEVPADRRLRRLLYAVVVLAVAMLALSLPLL